MAVLLAVLTFILFVTLDYVVSRRLAARSATVTTSALAGAAAEPAVAAEPVWVAGYELPEQLHYHRGHTWAKVIAPDMVVIGLDDFARKLLGRAKAVKSPAVGSWVRQGERGFGIKVDGRTADLVAPVEGEVMEVNPEIRGEPAACTEDPYGRGWICRVRSMNLAANLRNLLSGSLARRWMEDSRSQIELRLMALSGSVLQDGGEPVADFAEHLETEDWKRLVGEFLLT
ncbi:MAG: glycine cleavage system protein H [Planctomycetota bacterium]|jgi:glycine cleavage system H protein